jgi:hypothetical protein
MANKYGMGPRKQSVGSPQDPTAYNNGVLFFDDIIVGVKLLRR